MPGRTENRLLSDFYKNASRCGRDVAITFNNESLTYRDLEEKTDIYAKKILLLCGFQQKAPLPRIALLGNNKLEMFSLELAILRCGFIFVPIEYSEQPHVIASKLQASSPALTLLCMSDQNQNIASLEREIIKSSKNYLNQHQFLQIPPPCLSLPDLPSGDNI